MSDIKKKILIVEDELELAEILRDYLLASDLEVDMLHDGSKVVATIQQTPPDLLLLDLMLPSVDGMTLCKKIRSFSNLPILIMTAKVNEADCLAGFDEGADDYICKPVKPKVVVARIKAMLKRVPCATVTTPTLLNISQDTRRALWQDNSVELTSVEFRMLNLMLQDRGKIYSRELLMSVIYPDGRYVSERTIDTHVKNLRKKIVSISGLENPIRSIYGAGYKLHMEKSK